MQLRPYQSEIIDIARREFAKHDRLLIWLPTGAGKGVIMSDLTLSGINKGNNVLTIMRMRQIVFQTVQNYQKAGVRSNMIMANAAANGPLKNRSTVASIDTLATRIKKPNDRINQLKKAALVIIDEAHNCTSESYARFIWWLEGEDLAGFTMGNFRKKKDFKKKYIGFTATPFAVGNKAHTFFQGIINNISPRDLRDQGFLVPAKIFRAAKKIKRAGFTIDSRTGDYSNKALYGAFAKKEVVGDVVAMYKKHGDNGRAICFGINLNHSRMLASQFCAEGIPSVHCDASHTKAERASAIAQLKSGTIKVLCNVDIFSVGLDCPWLEVGIFARPTASEILAVQQWGRVLRPHKVCADCGASVGAETRCFCGHEHFVEEKIFALILDHANNVGEFGDPYIKRTPALTGGDIVERKKNLVKDCPNCFITVEATAKVCGACNYIFGEQQEERVIEHVDGELVEETCQETEYQILRRKVWRDYNFYRRMELTKNWKSNAKWYKLFNKYGKKLLPFAQELRMPSAWISRIE